LEGLVQARQFGLSRKSLTENVGFRGIGIYSGFDLCNRLVITTKKTEEAKSHILEFDFGSMKKQLEAERRAAQNQRTSLTQLLSIHSHFVQEVDNSGRSYTMVQLEDISDTHIDQLADRTKLRKYILLNLPIDFEDDFEYKELIYEHIRKYVKGYNVIKITLESDSAPRELVCRPAIPNLRKPELDIIYNAKDEHIACYWACLHLGGSKIPDQYADYRGFVYRVKGFTIGDNLRLQDRFKKGNSALYWWYMGEIFVLDHNLIPNAARDDFEASIAKAQLEIRVQKTLSELETIASNYQQQGRADTVIERSASQLQEFEEKLTPNVTTVIKCIPISIS
jgi:molecular chaperone HtpG